MTFRPSLRTALFAVPFSFYSLVSHAQTDSSESQGPVVVTATRQESRVSDVLADVTVIDRAAIEKASGSTVVDLLAQQPGIQVYGSGSTAPGIVTGIFLRGANADQTKVLVDGIPLGGAADQAGTKALANLSLANVERIEILRGPASTLYGADAIGGVIQIFTRKGTQGTSFDGFIGYGSYNTAQAQAGLSVGSEQWHLRFDGSRDQSDGFSAMSHATNKDADKDGSFNNAGSVALSWLPAQGQEVGLTYRANAGQAHYDGGDYPPPDYTFSASGNFDNRVNFSTNQWQVFTRNRITDVWTSKLQYGSSYEKQTDYSASTPDGGESQTQTSLATWQNDFNLQGLGLATLGVEQQQQQASNDGSGYDDKHVSNTAVFAIWSGRFSDHRIQLSARDDDHSAFGNHSTWAAAYGYQFTQQWRAQASYGTAFKAPSINQLYLDLPAWNFFGNPDLKPEEATNRELGLVWETETQTASATYYLNNIKNLIGSDATHYININKAKLEGATLTWNGRFDSWTLQAAYDWLNPTDEETGKQLQRRANNTGTLGVDKTWGALQTGVQWQAVGHRYDWDGSDLAAYNLVNLSARYAFTKALNLEGRVNNLFDREYEVVKGYNTPGLNAFVGLRYTPQ